MFTHFFFKAIETDGRYVLKELKLGGTIINFYLLLPCLHTLKSIKKVNNFLLNILINHLSTI